MVTTREQQPLQQKWVSLVF